MAPADARTFGAQGFVFGEVNEDGVAALLARTRADGGGNTFYNLAPEGEPQARGWVQANGTFLDTDRRGTEPGLSATSGGLEGGGDIILPQAVRLGAAIAYENIHVSDDAGGRGDTDLVRVSLYGSKTVRKIGFSAALSYAHGFNSTDRATGDGVASAHPDSDEVIGAFQASAPFLAGGVLVTPSAGVQVAHLHTDAFAERSRIAAFAVRGDSSSATRASPYVTVGLSRGFVTASGVEVTPDLLVGFRDDGVTDGARLTLHAADGTAFRGVHYEETGGGALLGASISAHRGAWTATAKYRATIAGGWTDNQVEAALHMAF